MKVDQKESCFEIIRIKNTSSIGANFVKCDLSGSEFDNVIFSGVNLNQAKLFNCYWRNLRINKLNKLTVHSDDANQVGFSPDGMSLASCSMDQSICLWDVKTGKIKSIIIGEGDLKSLCFSSNITLAYSSREFEYLWNLKTGKQIAKLDGHLDYLNSICFSPDFTTQASGSSDNSIRLQDVRTGKQIAKLDGHSSGGTSICYSPDGPTLASDSDDNSFRLWDIQIAKEFLPQDNCYKDLLSQFKLPLQSQSIQQNRIQLHHYLANFDRTTQRTRQNPILEASGDLF
ncbi:unnamed protein product [Paramecium octaurelia]|uniref:Uncharacterized protein n=1 Tax=Paramecium octaurelia TaxID=43137 RepID=A0A8S1WHK4_PAROT|nr:unnamed protein product [Paramecium octaurelia]